MSESSHARPDHAVHDVADLELHVHRDLFARRLGLRGRWDVSGEAHWFPGVTSVGMVGVLTALDVVWLDEGHTVLEWETLRPTTGTGSVEEAAGVLELPPGEATERGIVAGDKVVLTA